MNDLLPKLIESVGSPFDLHELRLLLDEHFEKPGQYDGDTTKLYLPLAGAECHLALTFKENKIAAIEPGNAFDPEEWESISSRFQKEVVDEPMKVGRNHSFSMFKVPGSWRGKKSGVQILPPDDKTPKSDATNENPFILEFPLRVSRSFAITQYRRAREHRNLTHLLNLLLAGRTRLQPRQPDGMWAIVPTASNPLNIQWVQPYFFGELGEVVRPSLSPAIGDPLIELPANEYYALIGNDGRPLRVPMNLDDSICLYQNLPPSLREKFDRALFWLSTASREWSFSASSAFASYVFAIESLTNRGEMHPAYCDKCNVNIQHETPGPTALFRDFLEKHAPGESTKKQKNDVYRARSGISHGSQLLELDRDRALGWDPPWWNERELHWSLASITRLAFRDWLSRPD